jgi:hypothetical protein
MSLDVLRVIAHLVEAGATVIGNKPYATPSLADLNQDFLALANAVWGSGRVGEHRYGKGWVLSGQSLAQALVGLNIAPDLTYTKPQADTTVWFLHRRLSDGDVYFVNNRKGRAERIEASFRLKGNAPEIWRADTGTIEEASYRMAGDRTIVPLQMEPHDAVFVVFRKPTQRRERTVPELLRQRLATVAGPWVVHFQPERGAPEQATFTHLRSWSKNSEPGIRYFSGTASYETSLDAPASWFVKGQELEIDLGSVKNLAEIVVNGHSAGISWKQPFRTDITGVLRPGVNRLAIRVTNLWPNRLIGDKQPNATPLAFTTFSPYSAGSPLLESGLLGPVSILRGRWAKR